MTILNPILKKFAQFKVYFGRSGIYISILNFGMIIANFKLLYDINISVYILIPSVITAILIFGRIDYSLIMKHEIVHGNKQNDIKIQLDKLENMIKELKEKENDK